MYAAHKMDLVRNVALATLLGIGFATPTGIWHIQTAYGEETVVSADVVDRVNAGAVPDSQKPLKDETVLAYADATGTIYDTRVKDKLINTSASDKMFDTSMLTDIEPGEGMEYTTSGKNLTWHAAGASMTYEGKTDLPCPVQMSITYMLDGVEVSPDQIAGASGKVTIRFDFQNTSTVTTTVDARTQTVYTPFVVLSGFTLDNDHFSNIQTTNAKAMMGIDSTTITGCVMPGMKENLAINSTSLAIPSYFEVTADTTGFELGTTTTIVMSGLFNGTDTSGINDGNARESLAAMSDAMNALVNGANSLDDGMEQLVKGTTGLEDGLDGLVASTEALPEETAALAEGARALNTGVTQAHSGVLAAADGSSQIALLAQNLQTELQHQATAAHSIDSDFLQPSLTATGNAQAAVQTIGESAEQATETAQLAHAAANDARADLESLSGSLSAEDQAKVDAALASLTDIQEHATSTETNLTTIAEASAMATTGLQDATSRISDASTAVEGESGLARSLDSLAEDSGAGALRTSTEELGESLGQLSSFVGPMQKGMEGLSSGTRTMADEAPALTQGISALKAGGSQLNAGMGKAAEGSSQLANGLQQFNREGVDQLIAAYDDNLGGLADRVKAIVQAGECYDTFSGKDPSMTGSVKFIYETDPITSN